MVKKVICKLIDFSELVLLPYLLDRPSRVFPIHVFGTSFSRTGHNRLSIASLWVVDDSRVSVQVLSSQLASSSLDNSAHSWNGQSKHKYLAHVIHILVLSNFGSKDHQVTQGVRCQSTANSLKQSSSLYFDAKAAEQTGFLRSCQRWC